MAAVNSSLIIFSACAFVIIEESSLSTPAVASASAIAFIVVSSTFTVSPAFTSFFTSVSASFPVGSVEAHLILPLSSYAVCPAELVIFSIELSAAFVVIVYVSLLTENVAPDVYAPAVVGTINNFLSSAVPTSALEAPIVYCFPAIFTLSPVFNSSMVNVALLAPSANVPFKPAS